MSIRTVERSIRHALADNKLTQAEAEDIVTTAEKGPVTTGEARRIAELYEDGQFKFPTHFPPGALPQPRPPLYDMEPGAAQPLLNFFIAERVPQAKMYGLVKEDIEAALDGLDRSSKALDEAPRVRNLHEVQLHDNRPADGERLDAFVDTRKDEFYLKSTGAGMAGPDTIGPFWYGPFPLEELSDTQRVAHRIDEWSLSRDAGLQTSRTHTPRVADVEDLGNDEFKVTLKAVNWQDPSDVRDSKDVVVNANGELLRVLDVTQDPPGLRPDRLQAMKDAFNRDRASLQFNAGGPPLGMRFERVLLEHQPGFDTYTYFALVPVGALSPSAPVADPNDADSIFIERQGGFAGITMVAGPIDVD
jgi:hypothetical protein